MFNEGKGDVLVSSSQLWHSNIKSICSDCPQTLSDLSDIPEAKKKHSLMNPILIKEAEAV